MNIENNVKSQGRVITYVALFVVLFLAYFLLRDSTWQGNNQLHTMMELIATVLASLVGILALVRFYTKKNNTFLFIGTGFLGTAFLDSYHAVVTSTFFNVSFPSPPPSLIPWSWIASRLFLSVLLFLSWWAWKREKQNGEAGRISEKLVYLGVGVLTLVSFLFFAFVPLPRAYYPEIVFHRPEEFVPAFFLLLALIGYLRKGHWKKDHFEHWLVLSIIVSFMAQAMFMSFSGQLFDVMFDAAHLLKKVSYVFVLTGLLISMYSLFKQAEENVVKLAKAREKLEGEVTERERAEKNLRGLMKEIREGVNVLSYSVSEILAANTQVASSASETAAAVGQTTATVEEVKQTAQLSSQKAGHVSESAQKAAQISHGGKKAVTESIEGMNHIREQVVSIAEGIVRLSEHSQAIGEIIATVNDLAERSNVLAVNAAIEAAKAGEQGKGFTVVAQEVRSLAEQSQQSTAQVRKILSDIHAATEITVIAAEKGSKAVEAGMKQSTEAGESIQILADSIVESAQAAAQIAASSHQQSVGMDQIASAMESIKQGSAQNVGNTKDAEI